MKKSHFIANGLLLITGVALIFLVKEQQSAVFPKAELLELLEQGEKQIDLVQLTAAADYEWTKVAVFGPYTTSEWMEEAMDAQFGLLSDAGEVLESEFLLVVANEQKMNTTLSLSRQYGDYTIKDNRYLIVQ